MGTITKYVSDIDGMEFSTEAEQKTYDAGLRNKVRIDAFVDKHYPLVEGRKAGPSRTIVTKAIGQWLAENQ